MRVIVTRPLPAALRTAEKLASIGHTPEIWPLTVALHKAGICAEALRNSRGAIAVTSAEVFRSLESLALDPSVDRTRQVFAVGPATAQAARSVGFHNIIIGSGSGQALADLLARHSPGAQPLLYLTGKPRSPAFEERLRTLSIPFESIECYEMQRQEQDVEFETADGAETAVLFYSQQAASQFFVLLEDVAPAANLRAWQFLCLSSRIAAGIPEYHRDKVKIAELPNEAAMMALLEAD